MPQGDRGGLGLMPTPVAAGAGAAVGPPPGEGRTADSNREAKIHRQGPGVFFMDRPRRGLLRNRCCRTGRLTPRPAGAALSARRGCRGRKLQVGRPPCSTHVALELVDLVAVEHQAGPRGTRAAGLRGRTAFTSSSDFPRAALSLPACEHLAIMGGYSLLRGPGLDNASCELRFAMKCKSPQFGLPVLHLHIANSQLQILRILSPVPARPFGHDLCCPSRTSSAHSRGRGVGAPVL